MMEKTEEQKAKSVGNNLRSMEEKLKRWKRQLHSLQSRGFRTEMKERNITVLEAQIELKKGSGAGAYGK